MKYGVVPSGGLGIRSGLPHSKELAKVAGRPVIEYVLDRLTIAGIKHIFVTSAPDKTDLNSYLSTRSPHHHLLTVLLGERRGLLDGIVSPAATLSPNDELYFGLPDTIWYPETGFTALTRVSGDLVLGVLPSTTPELFGSVTIAGDLATSIIEKPAHPTSHWIWAFGKFQVSIVPELLHLSVLNPVFTNLLGGYANIHELPIITFPEGKYFDTGTPSGLLEANQYVAN